MFLVLMDYFTCKFVFCFVTIYFALEVPGNSPTSDHGVAGSNPAGGEILPEPKRRFIAQSLSCSPFHRLEMTEILLKGRKTLTHPSIHPGNSSVVDSFGISQLSSNLLKRYFLFLSAQA